jgi:acetylornithine deacetylase/succinyl-diaminopimelate desuccinylase-like protein
VSAPRRALLARIAAEEAALVGLLSALVRAASPNPPGDTRAAAAVLGHWLEARGVPFCWSAPIPPHRTSWRASRAPGPARISC